MCQPEKKVIGSGTDTKTNLITLLILSLTDRTTAALITEFMSDEFKSG